MTALERAGDADVRRLAEKILQRSEFDRSREIDLSALPFVAYLQDWLDWLNGYLAETVVFNPGLFWLILCGLAVLSLLMIAHLVWTIRIALKESTPAAAERSGSAGRDFFGEAQALALSGRFLEAAHCLQLACIALVVHRRIVALSRSEPNRVLRRRISAASMPSSQQRTLVDLLDRTETAWFRDRADDPALYEAWRDLHARLRGLPVRPA